MSWWSRCAVAEHLQRIGKAAELIRSALGLCQTSEGDPTRRNVLRICYAEAEPLQKRSLAISEKALGPEHPDVGPVLNRPSLR